MKENKVVKFNLESEVDSMLDQGYSLAEIASTLKTTHNDIIDLQDLSAMSIMRYRDGRDKNNLLKDVDSGKDPVDTFLKKFNAAMEDLNSKSIDLYDRSIRLLDKLEKEDNHDTTLKAIKETTNSVEQLRKNWTSLVQYGIRQTSNIYNVNLKKEQNIKVLLLNWSKEVVDDLCPECKNKCRNKIIKLVEKEEKND